MLVPVPRCIVAVLAFAGGVITFGREALFHPPAQIRVGGKILDIAETTASLDYDGTPSDHMGHATPCLEDINGDGKRDLVVGGFSGRFRCYINTGTDPTPVFDQFQYLMAENTPARVRMWCCLGSRARFADFNGDGLTDMVSGSYETGYIYYFSAVMPSNGVGEMKSFSRPDVLVDITGEPVVPHPERIANAAGERVRIPSEVRGRVLVEGFAPLSAYLKHNPDPDLRRLVKECGGGLWTTAATVDWNGDGLVDILIGTITGEIFFCLNVGSEKRPVFAAKPVEIKIGEQLAVPEGYASVDVGDWDGDGLFDIIAGAGDGSVWLLRNDGEANKPRFTGRTNLIPPGDACDYHQPALEQWLERGEVPRRGGSAQIHVADFNRDGKLDILVGDWSQSISPKAELSRSEEAEMRTILAELQKIVALAGSKNDGPQRLHKRLSSVAQARLMVLRYELLPKYLEKVATPHGESDHRRHGIVWLFLRR